MTPPRRDLGRPRPKGVVDLARHQQAAREAAPKPGYSDPEVWEAQGVELPDLAGLNARKRKAVKKKAWASRPSGLDERLLDEDGNRVHNSRVDACASLLRILVEDRPVPQVDAEISAHAAGFYRHEYWKARWRLGIVWFDDTAGVRYLDAPARRIDTCLPDWDAVVTESAIKANEHRRAQELDKEHRAVKRDRDKAARRVVNDHRRGVEAAWKEAAEILAEEKAKLAVRVVRQPDGSYRVVKGTAG